MRVMPRVQIDALFWDMKNVKTRLWWMSEAFVSGGEQGSACTHFEPHHTHHPQNPQSPPCKPQCTSLTGL
eukprot:1149671-Pelagomonas_calceolata.AAC.6